MTSLLNKRPTETISGLGAALAVYGFCTQVGLPHIVAAIIAVVVLVVPYLVSEIVDVIRGGQDGAREVAVLEGGRAAEGVRRGR